MVQVELWLGTLEIWDSDEHLTEHPRAQDSGKRIPLPSQWKGIPIGDGCPSRKAIALALRATEEGEGAYLVRTYDMIENLREARIGHNEHNLDRRMKVHRVLKVLIVHGPASSLVARAHQALSSLW